MNGLTTMRVGPVAAGLYNLQARWASQPVAGDERQATLSGDTPLLAAHQLAELVANADLQVTIGRSTGVLVPVHFDSRVADQFIGWYLLESFNFDPYRIGDQVTHAGFSLSGAFLGPHREVVVSRSARAYVRDFVSSAKALVVQPFYGEDADGEPFRISPGGTFTTRAYDPSHPHDTSSLAPTLRALGINVGTVTVAGVDALAPVVLPDIEQAATFDGSAPAWLTMRGGDCRAFDRREGREVYGPSHPLVAPTDLIITNGVIRAWFGPRGMPPYLQVQAVGGDGWQEIGYIHLADPTGTSVLLTSVRLVRVTPESVAVAVGIQDQGNAIVTLHRGERMFRIRHGGGRTRVSCVRQVRWAGLPPWSRLEAAGQAEGKFGLGLDGGRDAATWDDPVATWDDPVYSWDGSASGPDLRLRWPASLAKTAWTAVLWWRPYGAAADIDDAGLLSILDSDDAVAAYLRLDGADQRVKFSIDGDTVQSTAQAFAAGAHVFVAIRFSEDDGMALTVKPGAGSIEHVKDAAALDPGTAAAYADLFFGASETAWGDGAWGDGTWGGVSYADGVLDNIMLFAGYLSDAELVDLAAAANRLDGLPSPESRLVWHLPGDPRPVQAGSAYADGRRFEATAEGGSTRSPDAAGLTRAVCVLDDAAAAITGLGITATVEQLDVGAFLATTGTLDDLADHHAQFAAASEQEVRVR